MHVDLPSVARVRTGGDSDAPSVRTLATKVPPPSPGALAPPAALPLPSILIARSAASLSSMRFADASASHDSMSRRFVVVPPPVLLLRRGAAAVVVVIVVVVLDCAIHHEQIHVVIRGIVPPGTLQSHVPDIFQTAVRRAKVHDLPVREQHERVERKEHRRTRLVYARDDRLPFVPRPTADVLSSPDVGSSRSTIAGSVSGSLPMVTLFFSPPDIMFIGVSAHLDNRSRRIVRSTLSTFLPSAHPVVHLDAIIFGCSGGRRRSNAAAVVTTTTPLTAANRINNQQTTRSGGVGGLRGDDTTKDEDMHTTIK